MLLTPFHLLVSLSTSARLCTCLFGLRSRPRGLINLTVAEADVRVRVRGRVVSVHRQRGQVRVVSVVAATETTNRRISAAALSFLIKELNLTTCGYYPSRVPFSRWHGFLCIVAVAPLPYINPRQMRLGFTKFLRLGRANARRFRFRASFQSAGAIASRSFRRRAIALLCFRRSLRSLSLRCDNRCRSRCPCTRPRAKRQRPSSTETGTRR